MSLEECCTQCLDCGLTYCREEDRICPDCPHVHDWHVQRFGNSLPFASCACGEVGWEVPA